MRGTNTDKQSINAPIIETEHSSPSQRDAVKADNQEQNAISNTSTTSKQTEAIEAEFERKKQEIEEYYADQFRQLQQKVEITLKEYDATDRAAYASFIERLKDTVSITSGSVSTSGYVSPYGHISAHGYYDGTTYTQAAGNPSLEYKYQVQRTNEAIKKLMGEYELDFEHLQRQKACALSDLEKEKKKAIVAASYQEINSSIHKSTPISQGTVTGILFSEETPLTVINGEVFREGQTINGVKVIKIYPDYVDFEKSGSRWSQRVNEPPSTNWP